MCCQIAPYRQTKPLVYPRQAQKKRRIVNQNDAAAKAGAGKAPWGLNKKIVDYSMRSPWMARSRPVSSSSRVTRKPMVRLMTQRMMALMTPP